MSQRLFVVLALFAVSPVDAHERLLGGEYGSDGKGWFMGKDFNMTEFMEKLKDVNYTDIFDRCCPTNTTVLPGITTQYDVTDAESCNCPVRSNDTFATKWDESCTNNLGPKILSGETGVDMEKLTEMFEKFMNKNYTDVYDRCCSSPNGTNSYDADPSSCKCPVRNSTEHVGKWEDKCENKYAVIAEGGDYNYGGKEFNFEVKNHTAVYMNCCPTQDGLPETDYDVDNAACSCPVRQDEKFAEKWYTECEETYGPKAMEEMQLPTVASASQGVHQKDAEAAKATSIACSLKGAFAVIVCSFLAVMSLF
uniref:Uncharacterized protein n=1 Tax=Pseudictyota dubia TaxID=2749911 RepID=A0A7R9VV91_9STRA